MKQKRVEEGFTLIELLIVVVILAILAAVVVFAVGTTTSNAKISACNADAKSVETAVELYKAQTGAYPPAGATGQSDLLTSSPLNNNGPWLRSWPIATVANNGYTITLDGTTQGQIDVTTSAGTINYDTQTTATGCNGIS